jgi:hypothetical protein
MTESRAFTLFVLPGLGELIDVMPRLPTIITATILDSAIVIVVGWGCTRLVWLLLCLTELEVPRRLILRRGHPLVSS